MPETDEKREAHRKKTSRLPALLRIFEPVARRYPTLVNIVIHSFLFALALLLAQLVQFDSGVPGKGGTNWFMHSYLPWLPVFVGLKLLIFGKIRLLRSGWRYASIRDVASILLASWVFVLIMFLAVNIFRYGPQWLAEQTGRGISIPGVNAIIDYFNGYSQGVLVLDFLATVFLVCTARLGFRLYREELRPISPEGVRRVLIIGAGDAAEAVVREIHRMQVERYTVVGLIDDDPAKRNITIHGVPVLGATRDMREICKQHEIEEIIIAMPAAGQKELRRVIGLCSGTKLKFQSLPGVTDLIDGRVTVSQMRTVDISDLLGREAVELDRQAVARFLRSKRVLITGAGGSIGSEMCRQVANYAPAQLILVEQAETPLFDIENELLASHGDIPLTPVICDIYDRDRVMAIWRLHRPEVVIHAAAHKHVPMMERNPCEAVKNNILGTKNVADASCKFGSDEFVTISTDKAVNPSSIMGASKRVAEIYTQALNGSKGCATKFKAVRFGNVLGSNGSVVPTFKKQISEGGPVTVTHPDMTRYFMTIPEAAQLVLQAAATGEGGQIYLLDMGESVKIIDLARNMITLSGFRPEEDIDIVFSGVRPGEKLFEELRTDGEDIEPTVHPKVNVWKSRPTEWASVEKAFKQLDLLQNSPDRERIVRAIRMLVPEYEPLNPPARETPAPAAAATAQAKPKPGDEADKKEGFAEANSTS